MRIRSSRFRGILQAVLGISGSFCASRRMPPRMFLNGTEPLRFSQRALNSVIIGAWCVEHAVRHNLSMWSVLERCLYVGGDTDTVGAVAGQLAGPLLPLDEVCSYFRRFAGLDKSCLPPTAIESFEEYQKPCLGCWAAGAAARRYFHRACLFSSNDWATMLTRPALNDPKYDASSIRRLSQG